MCPFSQSNEIIFYSRVLDKFLGLFQRPLKAVIGQKMWEKAAGGTGQQPHLPGARLADEKPPPPEHVERVGLVLPFGICEEWFSQTPLKYGVECPAPTEVLSVSKVAK